MEINEIAKKVFEFESKKIKQIYLRELLDFEVTIDQRFILPLSDPA
jgi:hypothetical protein